MIYNEGVITTPSDREILMQRIFRAPAQLMYDVWTKPEHVRRWYGVRGTTVTVCDIDLRVGGAWRWVVVRPDNVEIAFSGEFLELDPPRLIRRTERFEQMPGGDPAIVTITFEERDGGAETFFSATMLFPTKRERDMCLQSGMEHGLRECYANIDKIITGD